MKVYDRLVEWTSELGEGSYGRFQSTHDWLFGLQDPGGLAPPAYRTALNLAMLGYLEIDWGSMRWAAAPPILTLLPSGGGYGLAVGARTRAFSAALAEATGPDAIDVVAYPRRQPSAPEAIFIGGTARSVRDLSSTLGIEYEFNVADRLSRLLPDFSASLSIGSAAPPSDAFPVERWSPRMFRWTGYTKRPPPGLYRVKQYTRRVHRFLDSDGNWFELDGPTGMYAELDRTSTNVLRYRRDTINGTLFVPLGAPLPALQARSAALSCGLAPYVPHYTDRFEDQRL
ncbi:MAG: hypothetical protein U9R51_10415, partial [Actinomycetota bacterium]|nr:hypothetical protein [Actinomycetota bacterium]